MKKAILLGVFFGMSQAFAQIEIRIEVALCDVETQGVVPPNNLTLCRASLPQSNLYWGARYGVKTFLPRAFQAKRKPWPISTEEASRGAVERFALVTKVEGEQILLKATAWTDMKQAISAALRPESGHLIIFVGHNGLMDFSPKALPGSAKPKVASQISILACRSDDFFLPILKGLGHTPYVLTSSLMAPEAYVVEAIVRSFLAGKTSNQAAEAAGAAYSKFQNISQRAGRSTFWPREG